MSDDPVAAPTPICAPDAASGNDQFQWVADRLGNAMPCGWDSATRRWTILDNGNSWSDVEFGRGGWTWLGPARPPTGK